MDILVVLPAGLMGGCKSYWKDQSPCIKVLLHHELFLFQITGIIILALGVSVKAYYYPYDTFLDDKYFSLPNMLIATGSLIFFISFLGCYGAIRENWLMLMAFSVLLAIIFIFELSIGIAGYVLRDKTSSYLEAKLYNTMNQYNTSIAISDMWDLIQDEAHLWEKVPLLWGPEFRRLAGGILKLLFTNVVLSFNNDLLSHGGHSLHSKGYRPESNTTNVLSNATNVNISPQSASIVLLADDNTGEISSSTIAPQTSDLTGSTQTTNALNTTTVDIDTTMTSANTTEATPSTTESSSSSVTNLTTQTEDTEATPVTISTTTNVATSTVYPPSSSTPYTIGCGSAFGAFIKAHAVDIGAVGITLAMLQ
ncbi:hypothetical protein NQ317_019102, partial [Molorchus minor]